MDVQALTRNARMSPKKVREVARTIQGRKATWAMQYLALVPRKSARLLAKTLSAHQQKILKLYMAFLRSDYGRRTRLCAGPRKHLLLRTATLNQLNSLYTGSERAAP